MVLLTFGMETAFFKFFHDKEDKETVFRNSFLTVIGLNSVFYLLIIVFNQQIADVLLFSDHPEYIILLGAIVCIDAVSALPMAKLRSQFKAVRFSIIHSIVIVVNIGGNLIFLLFLMDPARPEEGVLFILIANLLSSSVKIIGTLSDYFKLKFTFNRELAKEMLWYAFPLVIAGFAGIINEMLDRVILKHLLYAQEEYSLVQAEAQLGIYSACYKLAVLVTIGLQAYRYAAEPFFFANARVKGSNELFVRIMNYFVAVFCLLFLLVSLNIDIFKYFITNDAFWVGLNVVPILLMANVFYAIYLNQSIWYKLSGHTRFGAYIAIGGAAITIFINLLFIPIYGFWASAWATFIVYGVQMIASYLLGQKYYPIPYNLKKFFFYLGLAAGLFMLAYLVNLDPGDFSWQKFFFHNALILFYVGVVWFIEKPKLAKN